jgi:MerR-like DNA binding protein
MNVMASTLVHPRTVHAASGCLGLAVAAAAVTGGPAAAEGEDLMTRRQVAMLFRVTSAVVATWARRGRLPEVRNEDGRPRYRRGDVEQLFRTEVARRLR